MMQEACQQKEPLIDPQVSGTPMASRWTPYAYESVSSMVEGNSMVKVEAHNPIMPISG